MNNRKNIMAMIRTGQPVFDVSKLSVEAIRFYLAIAEHSGGRLDAKYLPSNDSFRIGGETYPKPLVDSICGSTPARDFSVFLSIQNL